MEAHQASGHEESLRLSSSCVSDLGQQMKHHMVPDRNCEGVESIRASSFDSESSFSCSSSSSMQTKKKMKPSQFGQKVPISTF